MSVLPAAEAETAVELIARVKPSVVLVGSYGLLDSPRFGFSGTGFVVADGRHNRHGRPCLAAGAAQAGWTGASPFSIGRRLGAGW